MINHPKERNLGIWFIKVIALPRKAWGNLVLLVSSNSDCFVSLLSFCFDYDHSREIELGILLNILFYMDV